MRRDKPRDLVDTLRIAVVDDDPSHRRILRSEIEVGTPFEVIGEAGTGADAVRLVEEHEPDVVVIDVSTDVDESVEATRRIKSLYPHIHVFAFTAAEDGGDRSELEAAGATAAVPKEQAAEYLVHMLWSCLRGKTV